MRRNCNLFFIGLIAVARYSWAAAPMYTIQDLGALGATPNSSYVMGINKSGQVVGQNYSASGHGRAFLWDGSTTRDLGDLGGGDSIATGINSVGQVTGASTIAGGNWHPFLWNGTAMIDLAALSGSGFGSSATAFGINDSGHITGITSTSDIFNVHAFFWNGSVMQDIGTLQGQSSFGASINKTDQITGRAYVFTPSTSSFQNHAFFWNGNTMQDLGTLGRLGSFGTAINDGGQIAGYVSGTLDPTTGTTHAFYWNGTTMQDIGGLFAGNSSASYGYGMNNLAQIVGTAAASPSTSTPYHAFFWDGSTMWDLNNQLSNMAGWTELTSALAINDVGQVSGYGTIGGQVHAFLLTPVPSGGTLSVTTNLATATFSITGPANYSGGGTSFSVATAPAGAYTITYQAVSCYTSPISQTLTLTNGGSIVFGGSYTGAVTLSVNVTPASAASATFSINPSIPGMRNGAPYPVNQNNLLPQLYTVTFNPLSGFQTPAPLTLSPSPACALTFTGNYTQLGGTSTASVSITLNRAGGGFSVYDSNNRVVGSGNTLVSSLTLPAPATYVVRYNPLSHYYPPLPTTVMVTPGGSFALTGIYRRLILISFTGWNTAPSPSNCFPPQFINPFYTVGSGIRYDVTNIPGNGIISLLDEVQQPMSSLSAGALVAGFTFYSSGQSGSNACSTTGLDPDPKALDKTHVEARNWFNSQSVTSTDIIAVVGHSYGGNRARQFVEYLKSLGFTIDLLATVDPVDWDKCNYVNAIFNAKANCVQDTTKPKTHAAEAALSFYQLNGVRLTYAQVGNAVVVFFVTGYRLASPSTVILKPNDYHMAIPYAASIDQQIINDDRSVHTRIIDNLLSIVKAKQLSSQQAIGVGK